MLRAMDDAASIVVGAIMSRLISALDSELAVALPLAALTLYAGAKSPGEKDSESRVGERGFVEAFPRSTLAS
jgi:hypothetical protein